MDARWHKVVTGTLRRGPGEHRGLDINKALRIKVATHGHGNLVAQHKIALHQRATQVKNTMRQSCRFRKVFVIELKGRRHRRVQKLELEAENFNLTACHIGIRSALRASPNPASYTQAEFIAQGFRQLKHCLAVGVADNLRKALTVSKVNEDHAPVVAPTMHPAAECHGLIELACGKLSAVMTSHKNIL